MVSWAAQLAEPLRNVSVGSFLASAALLLVVYVLGSALYSVTLHPLAGFPGPKWGAISRIPWWITCLTGRQVHWMTRLHALYGPVVRYSPDDLSYVDEGGEAWKAIHAHEKGKREFGKAREWFVEPANGVYGINSALPHDDHRRYRHVFAPAFSERALKSQEPLFRRHIDTLLSKLSGLTAAGSAPPEVNMVDMYQFTTFDIMGDLCFGQPLGLLQTNKYSRWVEVVFDSVRVIPIAQLIQYYPWLHALFKLLEPQSIKDLKYQHFKHSVDRVDKRLQESSDKPDIWNLVLAAPEGQNLSLEEMYCHADVFMLAGSETTATCMSGFTYYVLSNPDKLALLKEEIRTMFSSESEITMESTATLKYLNACIQEALRLYPPVPVGVPRVVPSPGRTLLGRWVAPGTRVSVHHYATCRSPSNFADPNVFAPERWLLSSSGGATTPTTTSPSPSSASSSSPTQDKTSSTLSEDDDESTTTTAAAAASRFANDRRKSLQPFAFGPRNCIGQNMAMFQMRLFLACVFFRFDLELCERTGGELRRGGGGGYAWDDQRSFVLWEKKPLMVRVRPAAAAGGAGAAAGTVAAA